MNIYVCCLYTYIHYYSKNGGHLNLRLHFLMETWAFLKAHSKTRYGSLNHLTWNAFPTSSLIFTRSFPLEMAKLNVLQSIIHKMTVQMTVKVNSEICIGSSSVKAINLFDSQWCHRPRGLWRCERSTSSHVQ